MSAIFKREFRSYFNTMTGYIYIACVVIFTGIYFMAYNMSYGHPYFAISVISLPLIYTIAIPILTMKSFAEERKTKTDQLLLTAPVSVSGIVFGKFFSMMAVVAIPILISCICPIIISINGTAYFGVDYATLFAFFLLCGMYVSIGMFISSLTENQIISAVITFAALLLLYLWESLLEYIPASAAANFGGVIAIFVVIGFILYVSSKNLTLTLVTEGILLGIAVIAYLLEPRIFEGLIPLVLGVFSLAPVLQNFATYYVFDVGGLVFFLSVTALFIFLTMQAIQKRRWS